MQEQIEPSQDHIEMLARKMAAGDVIDPLNVEEVARAMDRPDFIKTFPFPEGRTWEEEAELESKGFKERGLENVIDVANRVRERNARGLPQEPKDLEYANQALSGEENPILWAIGETTESFGDAFDMAHEAYEDMNVSQALNGDRNVPLAYLKLNERVKVEEDEDEEDNKAADDPTEQELLDPEDLDLDRVLPKERDREEEKKLARSCPICWCRNEAPPLDPLNVHLLLKFVNHEGRILPRFQTKLCAKYQRKVSRTVRRAKHLGIFSFKKGRFTATDPFMLTQTHEDMLADALMNAWRQEGGDEEMPEDALQDIYGTDEKMNARDELRLTADEVQDKLFSQGRYEDDYNDVYDEEEEEGPAEGAQPKGVAPVELAQATDVAVSRAVRERD
jgi:ribosomal protein S18